MGMWKFKDKEGIEDFVLENLGVDFLIPSESPNILKYSENGDEMVIDTENGTLNWDIVHEPTMFSSKLSFRFHQWFGKGIIYPVNQ